MTVTITPEAAERGETYESVLTRARGYADPIQLSIGPIKCHRTQTGARIFKFPGASGSQNADLFAAKLREGIADVAKVAKPVKSAALEVVDLDDSVSAKEVVAAIAAAGSCSVEAVHGRPIRTGRRGLGTTRVDCPVTAAKAVLNRSKGRLLIGFSSAVVQVLEEQPIRCFKCFGIGHTRSMCPSSVERADTCYRCGKSGHMAASCDATTPRCAVCAASGRPANHVMAGRKGTPPTKKGKMQAPKRPAAANATVTDTPVTVADAGDEMIE